MALATTSDVESSTMCVVLRIMMASPVCLVGLLHLVDAAHAYFVVSVVTLDEDELRMLVFTIVSVLLVNR